MPALHSPDAIFSARHLPSWLMLTFAAGCVNATAVLACDRFVTHVTGTVTRIGMDLANIALLLDLLLVLTCFIGGAMVSGLVINARASAGKRPWFALPLLGVALIDIIVAVLGWLGWFGPFGQAIDQNSDFWMLALLSFSMGLQNGAVATSTGMLVRTTHLTGPSTDLGIHLAELTFLSGPARTRAGQHALLRFGKIMAFACGAALPIAVVSRTGHLVLLVPAAITLLAMWTSFYYSDEAIARRLARRSPDAARKLLTDRLHTDPYVE